MKLRKKDLRQLAVTDPTITQQIEQLFQPPLLWKLQPNKTRNKLAQITQQSAKQLGPIIAAVSRLTMEGTSWKTYRFGDRAWQTDAWRLYDIIGQLRFVSNWIGNSIGQCTLQVWETNPDGTPNQPTTNQNIAALANIPLGTGDTRAENIRLLGIQLFVAGESYIIAEPSQNGNDSWWVVTAGEIKKQGDKITIRRSQNHGGGILEYRDGTDLVLRVYTPHPKQTDEPDSPTRSAIPDLRELEALKKREFAELDSRLTGAGILALPETLALPTGQDDPQGATGFSALLGRIMAQSLRDRSSAEAMVPIITTGPAEDIANIRHITFWSDLSDQIPILKENALRFLAQSLDIPPEVLLGIGSSTNHWNAWAISKEAIQVHIKPILTRIAAALTTGYLQSALEILGENPTSYCYTFDTAPLTTNPDRTGDALNLHDRMLISDQEARDAGAWEESSAPDETERARRLTEKLYLSNPEIVLADETLRALVGIPGSATVATTTTTGTPAGQPAPVEQDTMPPEPDPNKPVDETPPGLSYAASIGARRFMSLVGAKLVPHSKRPADMPRYQLHTLVGPIDNADHLVPSGWFDDLSGLGETFNVNESRLQNMILRHCLHLLYAGEPYQDQGMTTMINNSYQAIHHDR